MGQHLIGRIRAQRLRHAGARLAIAGLAASVTGAATLPAPARALPVDPSTGAPISGVQGECGIQVAYAHVGTSRDDSLHYSARIRASVTDVRGAYTGWFARVDVPPLNRKALADSTGHAELLMPWEQLTRTDSVVVRVVGIGHHAQAIRVRVAPGTVAMITATLCLMPNDGPMAMQLVTTNARAGSACRIWLAQPDPSTRVRAVDPAAPAIIRGTISDSAGAPLQSATLVLAIFRGAPVTRPGAYTSRDGRAVLMVPADQLAGVDSVVVYARRVGYEPQHVAARIVPGDTIAVNAVLCLPRKTKSEFTDVRSASCSGADTTATRLVRKFVTEHAAFQAEHHMAPIDPGTVRLLTDAQDEAICRRLNAALPTATYVSGGAYYFALMPRRRVRSADGTLYYPEWRQIAVFDRDVHLMGVEGM